MAHTHTKTLYHVIYSTKQRRPMLPAALMGRLTEFTGGLIRQRDGKLLAMNGNENHVHLLASLTPAQALSDQVRDIKAISSAWIKREVPRFAWQNGYSAFTVSRSIQPAMERYIAAQVEHHRTRTFEEELVELLEKAGVDYDPRFVFD